MAEELLVVGVAVMVWVSAPCSDHPFQRYILQRTLWRNGALIVFSDPWTTVMWNGVCCRVPFTMRLRGVDPGREPKVSTTVRGSSRTLVVDDSPPTSVAVSCSSIQQGYSWSGAVND